MVLGEELIALNVNIKRRQEETIDNHYLNFHLKNLEEQQIKVEENK